MNTHFFHRTSGNTHTHTHTPHDNGMAPLTLLTL